MAFDIAKAVESIGQAVEGGFSYAEKAKENQSETEIIKINKRYVKALNTAEKLILLTYRYFNNLFLSKTNPKHYKRICSKT